jgi:hypothetical protein
MSTSVKTFALVTVAALAGAANAQVISGTYDDLAGSWDGTTFTASAVDTASLHSHGNVARTVSPIGNAIFNPGFVSAADPANFTLSLTYVNIGPGLGTGSGSFSVVDVDGSTISGSLSGFWIDGGSFVAFNGSISSVSITGGTFDGNTGSWINDLLIDGGAINQLYLVGPGNFFTSPYSDVPVNLTFQLTPTPGALAVLGLGGLVVGRRRR